MYNFIGIDVSKLTLQIYIEENNSSIEINNSDKSLRVFYRELQKLTDSRLKVMKKIILLYS